MFGFLKKKLQSAVEKFTKSAQVEAEDVEVDTQDIVEEQPVEPKVAPTIDKKPDVVQEKEPVKEEEPAAGTKPELKNVEKELAEKKQVEKEQPAEEKIPVEEKIIPQEVAPKVEEPKIIQPPLDEKEEEQTITAAEEKVTEVAEPKKPELQAETKQEEPVKRSLFGRLKDSVTKKRLSDDKFEQLFFDLEITLLENNVAMEVIEKIKQDLRESLVETAIDRSGFGDVVMNALRKSIEEVLDVPSIDVMKQIANKDGPYIIAFIGINGSGKTTSMAKFAKLLQDNGKSVVMAACDTYRAAAIQQLDHHAQALNIKIIKHDYGADASAVAFDAIAHAKTKHVDVVLLDTAGRLHHNENLMAELHKLIRIAKPDLKIFVGESITGNDCVEQARIFNEKVGIDGIILTKADVDEKGGAALSVSYITKKPIVYIGTGQKYENLEPFNKETALTNLGL